MPSGFHLSEAELVLLAKWPDQDTLPEHLTSCPECAARLETWKTIVFSVPASWNPEAPLPDAVCRVWTAGPETTRSGGIKGWGAVPEAAAVTGKADASLRERAEAWRLLLDSKLAALGDPAAQDAVVWSRVAVDAGSLWARLGDYSLARRYYALAARWAGDGDREPGAREQAQRAWTGLVMVQGQTGETEGALSAAASLLAGEQGELTEALHARLLIYRGLLEMHDGRLRDAEQTLEEARALPQVSVGSLLWALALEAEGMVHAERRQFSAATGCFQDAMAVYTSAGNAPEGSRCHWRYLHSLSSMDPGAVDAESWEEAGNGLAGAGLYAQAYTAYSWALASTREDNAGDLARRARARDEARGQAAPWLQAYLQAHPAPEVRTLAWHAWIGGLQQTVMHATI